MLLREFSLPSTPSLMEGYFNYLMRCPKMTKQKTLMIINLVRKFQNYVGKSYIDVTPDDIRGYLSFLMEHEHLKNGSLPRHLAAIRRFYDYLTIKGEIAKNPCKLLGKI